MKQILTVTTAAICVASGSFAQTVGDQGSFVELSYNVYTSDIISSDTNLSRLHFSTGGAYNFTPSFGVQYGVGFNRYSISDDPSKISLDFVDFDVHGYYNINADTKVGVFVSDTIFDQILIDFGGPSFSLTPNIYGLIYGGEVMASFSGFDVEAYAGVGSIGGDTIDLIGVDVDILAYGASVSYEISPKLSVNASVDAVNFDIESGSFGIDLLSYEVGAEYAINSKLSVNANVHGGSLLAEGDGLEIFGYGVGVEYDLPVQVFGDSELTAFASVNTNSLSATFGGGSEDMMSYKFGVRMSFGGVASDNKLFSGPSIF